MKRKAKRVAHRKEKPLTKAELKKIAAGFRQAETGIYYLANGRDYKTWDAKSDK